MAVLSAEEQEKIVHAISLAENKTSGEIRVVVENTVGDVDPITKAKEYFEELEMHKTTLRNGVLIYLAVADHQFAIIGDAGIDQYVQHEFWESTKEKMVSFFRNGDYVNGLIEGIHEAGDQLQQFFPRKEDDINELSNDIYFGKH